MGEWQPIETAPRDGTPILAIVDSLDGEACPDCCEQERLCLYHAHSEGMSRTPTGFAIVEWGGAWDDRTYEDPNGGWLPDWWFRVGSEFEEAANPTHWMPLPEPPEPTP